MNSHKMVLRSLLLVLSAWALLTYEPAEAADKYWVGGSGNWNDANHWSLTPGGGGGTSQPKAGEDAWLDDGGMGWVVSYVNPANPQDRLAGVYIGGKTHLSLTAGDYDLNVYGLVLGYASGSSSSVLQTQGALTTEGDMYIGYDTTANCTYRMMGEGPSVAVGSSTSEILWVGYLGQGEFDQQAGAVSAPYLVVNSTDGYVLSGDSELSVGVVEFVGYYEAGTFTQHGGTHAVGEQLAIGAAKPGTFYLNGGSLSAPEAYVAGNDISPGSAASLLIGTGAEATFASRLKLWTDGTVALNGGTLNVQSVELGGTFNFNGGTLSFLGGWSATPGQVTGLLGSGSTIGPWQTVRVNGAAVLFTPLILDGGTLAVGELVNPGLLAFSSGTFELLGGELPVSNNGPFGATLALSDTRKLIVDDVMTIAGYGLVLVDGDALRTGALFNSGQVRLTSPTSRAVVGELVNDGEIWLADDAARLAILTAGGLNNGLIAGSGHVLGPLSNEPAGEIRVGAGDRLVLGGLGNNAGLVDAIGGTVEFEQYLYNGGGALISARGAELRFNGSLLNAGALAVTFGTTDVFGDVENAAGGQVVVSGNSQATFYDDVVNTGTIQVSTGSTAVFFGDFSGNGCSGGGTVFLEGDTRPGASPGTMNFGGDVVFGALGELHLELNGPAAGTEYDQVNVTASAALAGNLDVQLALAYVPLTGRWFDVLTAGSRSGTFAGPEATGYAAGKSLVRAYDAAGLSILATWNGDATCDGAVDISDLSILAGNYRKTTGQVWASGDFTGDGAVDVSDLAILAGNYRKTAEVGNAPVPEPATLVLLAVGAAAVVRRRRR